MDIISTNITRAERDNDLIYHYDVPSFSQLSPVQEIAMVKGTIPPGLLDFTADTARDGLIFGDLLGWGAKGANGLSAPIFCHAFTNLCSKDIDEERVNMWLKSEVFNKIDEVDAVADQ